MKRLMLAAVVGLLPAAHGAEATDTFAVTEYRVLGNSVLPATEIETRLYPLLGANKTIQDVEAARAALETLYRDRGYGAVYVDIPEQRIEAGLVRLRVTEGKLDRLRLSGTRYYSNRRIVASLPSLQPGTVLHLPTLQAELTQLNQQSRDRQVTPVLRPGSRQGEVDIELKVQDELPLHAAAEYNNRYTANTTESRLNLTASYDNLFQRYQSLSLQYQTSPEKTDEVRMVALTYIAPLAGGNALAVYGVDTNSDFAAAGSSAALAILGAGRIYGTRYVVRLPATASSQTLSLGADYKRFRDDIVLTGGLTDTTPINYLGWSLAWGGNWRRVEQGRVIGGTGVNISANFGLRGIVNKVEDFEFKRFKARPNYLHLRADFQHEQPLFVGTTLFLRGAGQWTDQPLISNEQYAIGGADTVRGYLESEQLGDLGVAGSVEWRSPSIHRFIAAAFFDAGLVRTLEALPDADGNLITHHSLSSAGVGLRFDSSDGFTGALDWAYPLRTGDQTSRGDSRLHMQVRYGF